MVLAGCKEVAYPARHGFATELFQQVMYEQSPGHQHLTGRVVELLARHRCQEFAEGHWGHSRAHDSKTPLWQLVGPPGVQLVWATGI